MRKELYNEICNHLRKLYRLPDGSVCHHVEGTDVPEGAERIIKHIDLWNHNVEFIEQEENWARPAVFVEFKPIKWAGMCGGCRLTVGGQTKFACVDGPDFDGHLVDFDEAIERSSMYRGFERQKHEETCNLFKKEVQ